MKVVISRCYGGFGLSNEAVAWLAARNCKHVTLTAPADYYGENWQDELEEAMARKGTIFGPPCIVDGMVANDEFSSDASRSDPLLVELVESMGAAANGFASKLEVIEIPDGVSFVVEEYDGFEHVAETHRTWP